MCQPCAYGGTNLSVIKGIQWKTTLHGEGVVFYENIRMTCLIITRSTIWITIKPCRCDQRLILLRVEDVDNQPTLCKGPSQFIFIGWSSPTWWCKCEHSTLNRILQKQLPQPPMPKCFPIILITLSFEYSIPKALSWMTLLTSLLTPLSTSLLIALLASLSTLLPTSHY